jgi:hypothetical protein
MDFTIENYPGYNFSIRLLASVNDLTKLKQLDANNNIVILNPQYVKTSFNL